MLSWLKRKIRRVVATGYYLTGMHKHWNRGKVLILMYHRVVKNDDKNIAYMQPGMFVTETTFETQMSYLAKHYRVISLDRLLENWQDEGFDSDSMYCVITFDDGWLDNYSNAYPVLRKYNMPATIFLATAYIGTSNWFWPEKLSHLLSARTIGSLLRALKNEDGTIGEVNDVLQSMSTCIEECKLKDTRTLIDTVTEEIKGYSKTSIELALSKLTEENDTSLEKDRLLLNWSEVTEMSEHDISFGSHTCNHKILTDIPLEEAEKELVDSMQVIKKHTTAFVPVFCYPNGNNNKEIQSLVKRCGYQAAVTTKYGLEGLAPSNKYGLWRVGLHDDISSTVSLFALRLSGIG